MTERELMTANKIDNFVELIDVDSCIDSIFTIHWYIDNTALYHKHYRNINGATYVIQLCHWYDTDAIQYNTDNNADHRHKHHRNDAVQ